MNQKTGVKPYDFAASCVMPSREGVEERDQKNLSPLLRLKYHDSLSDAIADLAKPEDIGLAYAGFQKYLYQGGACQLLDGPREITTLWVVGA